MSDARHRGWGNPDSLGFRLLNVETGFTHSGVAFPGGVHRKIAKLVHAMLEELEQAGYVLKRGQCWAWANRDIRGRPGVKSNHAWALAIDVNAPANPMTSDGVVHTNLPPNVAKIAHKYGFIWGGSYAGIRKDPMHFEFVGTPASAKARTRGLNKQSTPVLPEGSTVKPADFDFKSVELGDKGDAVRVLQALLNVNGFHGQFITGIFDSNTEDNLIRFQRREGIKPDGIAAQHTMRVLLRNSIK